MRKKIIIFIILLVVISIPVAIKVTHKPEQRETKVEETITAKEALNINENKKQDSKKDLQVEKPDEEIKLIDKGDTTAQSKKEKEVKHSNSNSKQDEQKKSNTIIESEKQEIWEALGMAKDQYYNQPMYNWEKVDFKTMNECLEYGNKYKPYLDGEVLYNCHDVLSASGKFLGVMFDTEKLN